jgi:hypothetical protein
MSHFRLAGFRLALLGALLTAPSRVHAAPEPPWNREAHAEHLVGSIAASVGAVRQKLDAAHGRKAVFDCVHGRLDALRAVEARARQVRSALRLSWLEDDGADTEAYETLVGLEASARSLRDQADGCSQPSDNDSDGIPDKMDTIPDSDRGIAFDGRAQRLEETVDALKSQISHAHQRMALLRDNVLAGPAAPGTTAAPSTSPGAPTAPPSQPSSSATPPKSGEHDASMLIRTAEIVMAVFEVQKNVDNVERAAVELGGYLALRTDHEITVRVPRGQFDELVRRVERMGDVLHKNVAAEDVTDQYVDIDIRLKNARAVRDRLEKLLASATVRDAIEIQKELAKITGEIESLEGKLKLLRDRIAYSTVTVAFEQTQAQKVKAQALLPFAWMATLGLSPLLQVPR